MQEFDLTEKQVNEIKNLNARLVSIKTLLKEFTIEDNRDSFNLLVDELGLTQQKYEDWFVNIGKDLQIETTPEQKWNVDFDRSKIQLIG